MEDGDHLLPTEVRMRQESSEDMEEKTKMRYEETGSLAPLSRNPSTLAAQAHFLACDGKQMLFTRA